MPRLTTIADPFGLWPRASRLGVSVAESLVDALLRGPLPQYTVEAAIRERLVERIVDELLEQGVVEQVAERMLRGPELDRVVSRALESPRATELADHILESEGMERLVTRFLASEELWLVVEEIARSPAVTNALTHQSAGFVDQVAEEMGERSRHADARLERGARRLLHRRPRPAEAP